MSEPSSEKARKLRRLTSWFLGVCALFLGVWDVFVATNDVKGDTISELLRDISGQFVLLPFMLMGVMGHLFLNKAEDSSRKFRPQLLIFSCIFVGSRDLVWLVMGYPPIENLNLLAGAVGFALGGLWWPQVSPTAQQGPPPAE